MIRPVLVVALLAFAAPAWPCTVGHPLSSPDSLVRDAEVIARVRAEGLSPKKGRIEDVGGTPTQVRFTVLEVLKGRLPSSTLEFNGRLTERDDPNRGTVPYTTNRPGGHGTCVAVNYRTGAEYLFLLRRPKHPAYGQLGQLTPYWTALSPTNEQLVGGARDPWFVWVNQELRRR